ncbi:MAG: DUF4296 domain-containing protein [Thermonemataceae bacterium]
MLASCQKDKENVNILNEEKMVAIMVDIHLTEAQVPYLAIKDEDTLRAVFHELKRGVFKKHGTDSSTFYKSYDYYLNNLEEMQSIYEVVLDSLTSKEASLDIDRPIVDSLEKKKVVIPRKRNLKKAKKDSTDKQVVY